MIKNSGFWIPGEPSVITKVLPYKKLEEGSIISRCEDRIRVEWLKRPRTKK